MKEGLTVGRLIELLNEQDYKAPVGMVIDDGGRVVWADTWGIEVADGNDVVLTPKGKVMILGGVEP